MSKLIDVDEAIINFGFEWDDIPPTREEFVLFLKKQSIIDAVPVTRCKDCKYMTQWADVRYCTVWDGVNGMGDDGFCNYGERKGGGNND